MLTLTDHAQDAVRALTPQAPESAWLRIAPGNQGFELSLVTEPVPGDALIDDGKVQVFVEPQTAQLLDEQTLDAQLDEGGEVNFFLASPDAMPAPGGDDDGTAARHVASRAELLPEERAAGSDDPQAQARGILEASLDKKPARPLTAADLCDRCSARAAVETVMMQGGSLLWCAHHFAVFEDALNAFGATILVDERRR